MVSCPDFWVERVEVTELCVTYKSVILIRTDCVSRYDYWFLTVTKTREFFRSVLPLD